MHEICVILANHRSVRRNDVHLEAVDLHELGCLGVGRAGHTRELLVETEIVLEGDRRDGLVLFANADTLFGFDGLMQTIGPATPWHGSAGELVDDDHLAATHDVFHITLVERMRTQRRVQVMHQANVRRVVKTLTLTQQTRLDHQGFHLLVTDFGQVHLALLFVDRVITGRVGFAAGKR